MEKTVLTTYIIVADEERGGYSIYPVMDEARFNAVVGALQAKGRKLSYTISRGSRRDADALAQDKFPGFRVVGGLLR